jgi:ArsR family metal-binding transcriptional regulator
MADSSPLTHSTLSDEIEVINAIYGATTVSVTSINDQRTATSLHLEPFEFSFLLSFPSTYPAERPIINGIDILLSSASSDGKTAIRTLRQSLDDVWAADSICLYDLIEHFNEAFYSLEEPSAAVRPPQKMPMPKEQVRIRPIDLIAYQQTVACTACLDEGLKVDMGRLSCGHFYCSDCLHSESTINPSPFICLEASPSFIT